MNKTLNIYSNLTINSGRDTHYLFTSIEKYLNALRYNVAKSLSIDNYRINANTIKVKIDDTLLIDTLPFITYAIEYYSEGEGESEQIKYYRCYFVKSFDVQSGYAIFTIEKDKWASNIANISPFNLEITRSNRLIGNAKGVFDEVTHTKGSYDVEYLEGMDERGYTTIGTNHVAIALLLQFNISQQVFGDDKISRTMLFITDSAEWVYNDHKTSIQNAYKYSSYLELLAGAVGTITGVSGNLGTLDAQVIKAWVVDTQRIDYGNNTWHINASCKYGGGSITLELTYLEPMQFTEHFRIENPTPNKVYYVGTYLNGFKLTPYYEKYGNNQVLNFDITYIVDDNEVKIIASQGERIKDITNMFELYLNTNASQTTSMRYIARCFNASMGAVNSTFGGATKGVAMGGAVMGAVMGGLSFWNSALGMVPMQPSFENAIGGGDAMRTFALPCEIENDENVLAPYVRSPYVITTYESARDEYENACVYGLNYHEYISQLSILLSDSNYPKFDHNYRDFLQCECELTNVCKDDADYITNELRRGIFIEQIE